MLGEVKRAAPVFRSGWRCITSGTTNRKAEAAPALSDDLPPMPPCDFTPGQYEGPTYDHVISVKKNHVSPAAVPLYQRPLLLHQGHMQWLFDNEGRRYLDLFAGIVTVGVGHCHPKVVAAAKKQMGKLWHTTSAYLHAPIHQFAEKLVHKMPGNLKVAIFVNSGSEANDMAMLLSRLHTGCNSVISLRNAYHGASPYTMGLTALSTWRYNVADGFGIHQTMNPDVYQGMFGGRNCRDCPVEGTRPCACPPGHCEASDKYVDQLKEVLKYSAPKGRVAGFFAEPIQGVGGVVQMPRGYLKKAYEVVREHGGLCIADEVQTGFGRTGDHFWGFEGHGVQPDIVTMAKGIGNGFPMAAVVTTPEIAQNLTKALHINTFGGNPLACAIGSTVLDVIEEDRTQENSRDVGTMFLAELGGLREDFSVVGDVRGKGLMMGMEMVQDQNTRQPMAPSDFGWIFERVKDYGVLVGKGGVHGNVFRIKPPMCITEGDVRYAVAVFRRAIQDWQSSKRT